jgi:hypothetical protein
VECAADLFVRRGWGGGVLYLIVVNTRLSRCCRSLLLLQERLTGKGVAGGGEGCLLAM